MNIEEIRGDIFKLFDLKIDKDDPIWAFLYANKEVINNLEEILEISKKENKDYHSRLQEEMKEFSDRTRGAVDNAVEKFDFRIEEFNRDITKVERFHEDLKAFHNRYLNTTKKFFEDRLSKLENIFDSNVLTVEHRIEEIVNSIDYNKFNDELDKQMQSTLKYYLQEVRAGVAINKKGLEHLGKLKDDNETVIRKLESRVSMLTNLAFFQTIMFGASLTLLGIVYFAQGNILSSEPSPQQTQKIIEAK